MEGHDSASLKLMAAVPPRPRPRVAAAARQGAACDESSMWCAQPTSQPAALERNAPRLPA